MKAPLTILALDDDPDDLNLLGRSLRALSAYDVVYVPCLSRDHALQEMAARPIDILFVDYYLGRENGEDVLRHLRERGWAQPAIAITGQLNPAAAAGIVRAGACDFIVKDKLDPDQLGKAIDAALEGHDAERRRAAEARSRIESGKLEAVGALAGGIAHDFNNMLTGLLGYLELAKLKCEGRRVMDDLEHMEDTCRHMVELARRMLTFVREGGGAREPVNMHNLVLQVDMIFRPSLPEAIDFFTEPPPSDAIVLGWAANLQETMLGILQNAVDAMPGGGRLSMKGRVVHTDGHDQTLPAELRAGGYVEITVSDTGSGIPDGVRDRIFEPFFSTKSRGTQKGQGLGLAFVWKCVSDLGGVIEVDSAEGAGTRFRIYLPLAPAELTSAPRTCEWRALAASTG